MSKEAKHTEGPWEIREERTGIEIEHKGRDDHHGLPTRIVVCKLPFRRTGAKRGARVNYHEGLSDQANAALIAAAPDMLEALEACHRVVSDYWQELGGGLQMDVVQMNIDMEAAIAKAKGEA